MQLSSWHREKNPKSDKNKDFQNARWKSSEASSHSNFKYVLHYGRALSFVRICVILAFHMSKYSNALFFFSYFCIGVFDRNKWHTLPSFSVHLSMKRKQCKMNQPHFSDCHLWWLIFCVCVFLVQQLSSNCQYARERERETCAHTRKKRIHRFFPDDVA